MRKTLIGIGLTFTVLACSSQKYYVNSGKCVICGKSANWNSIGYCHKHFSPEREQMLRGVAKNDR